ncbi:MAG TPA: maleylpyruvate isomerase family mycothiol-dependent enzyme [Pseudonocardiaceae bacterium]|nr:maleylpyruvate isomerase family mycothiol-dependent enzyme [Pseudonocardiaceae bacterium]
MTVDFDRYCAEIVTQTELLTAAIKDADLRARVPSCPNWSLGDLVRHIGYGHRWAAETVRTRATEFLPDDEMRDLAGDDTVEPPVDWLREGAVLLADALRAAGPDEHLWAPFHYDTTSFYARRFTHETAMHRADATLAAGTGFDLAADVAVDALDEWAELDATGAFPDPPGEARTARAGTHHRAGGDGRAGHLVRRLHR